MRSTAVCVLVAILVVAVCAVQALEDQKAVPDWLKSDPLSDVLVETAASQKADPSSINAAKTPLGLGDIGTGKGAIDQMIDGFINAVKNGNTDAFGGAKATVLSNSNVLNHKEGNKNGNFEEKLKKTKEEGAKSKREDFKKTQMEEKQKRLEDKAKKDIVEQKEKLRQKQIEAEKEQDKKAAEEETSKAQEAQEKRTFEAKTKATVKQAREKALEEEKKAAEELKRQRQAEDKKKEQMEQENKNALKESQQKADTARQQAENEARQKQEQEKQQKENEKKAEDNRKQQKRREEEQEKARQREATGKWCGCTNVRVMWDQNNKWNNCPDGTLITGIYRGQYQNLANIYYYRCCQPCREDGSKKMAVHSCTVGNWWRSFDYAGWSYCPDNTYIQGFYKSSCNWIYCLEMARCCYIAGSRGRKDCQAKQSWGLSFDNAGWNYLDDNRFMIGLYRSGDHYLYNIEYPNQCLYYSYP